MTKIPSLTITLSGAQVSDLFFNRNNESYSSLFEKADKDNPPTRDEIRAALILDAKDFVNEINAEYVITADDMADDFLGRL
jgi:hypothetical protein